MQPPQKKIPTRFSYRGRQVDTKNHVENKYAGIVGKILKKNNCEDGVTLPNIKMYYKASVMTTVRYQHIYRQADFRNRQKGSEIDTSTYRNLVYEESGISNHDAKMNFLINGGSTTA